MAKGKFIVFEGIDGAGKSTQVELLAAALERMGLPVALTAEPTAMSSGRYIRSILSGERKASEWEVATLFLRDRIAHNLDPEDGIVALLERGYNVICDRYYYSTLAYQGSSTDYEWVKAQNFYCPAVIHPDVCIYLDLSPEQSLARIHSRGTDSEIYETVEKLTAFRERFLSVLDDLGRLGENILVLNADRTQEELAEDILQKLLDCKLWS